MFEHNVRKILDHLDLQLAIQESKTCALIQL